MSSYTAGETVAPAAAFTALYSVALIADIGLYLWLAPAARYLRLFAYVTLFLVLHVAAFALRVAAIDQPSNVGVITASITISSIASVFLLRCVLSLYEDAVKYYTTVLEPVQRGHHRVIAAIRLALLTCILASIAMSVVSGVYSSNYTDPSAVHLGQQARLASVCILLGATLLQCGSFLYLHHRLSAAQASSRHDDTQNLTVKLTHSLRTTVLALMVLLIWRSCYTVANASYLNSASTITSDSYYYPLYAVPEIVAITILLIPRLYAPYVDAKHVTERARGAKATNNYSGTETEMPNVPPSATDDKLPPQAASQSQAPPGQRTAEKRWYQHLILYRLVQYVRGKD